MPNLIGAGHSSGPGHASGSTDHRRLNKKEQTQWPCPWVAAYSSLQQESVVHLEHPEFRKGASPGGLAEGKGETG